MPKRVLYGVANYEELVRDNGYFVDKTPYIARLEAIKNPVFLRPRRFGKSLLCRMLECYYNVGQRDQFEELFGHTWIGQHPTPLHNTCITVALDFSVVEPGPSLAQIEHNFKLHCNYALDLLRVRYPTLLGDLPAVDLKDAVAANLGRVCQFISSQGLPPLYVIIDEYDNFANQLITGQRDQLYRELTREDSFLKTFFKALKEGRKTGAIANVFVTGVLPITMDDLASGFNIATFITLDPEFEAMLGFTQAEVDQLLDEVYRDYAMDPATRRQVDAVIRNHYNGYHFVNPHGEALYNSTILLYFLHHFTRQREIPSHLIDLNLRTDLSWVRRLTGGNPQHTEAFVDQLTLYGAIRYDDVYLVDKFNMFQFFEPAFFPVSFFYLGMLTRQDEFHLRLPNLTLRQIFVEYFNELHRIDVSTRYQEIMAAFVAQPELAPLFAGYWREYVSQLPEAIFSQVNENFYRTTFFELCSRYLSRWFTWNVERSYPSGRSDLEFVGKYHERYAGLRWVIEFKYLSNAEFAKYHVAPEAFPLQEEDTRQIAGYVAGLRQEYPEARIRQFVIYCFGNQGFRVCEVIGAEQVSQGLQ
jgi:hypothetical protein